MLGSLLLVGWLLAGQGRAETLDAREIGFFEENIKPILVGHCYECHSHASGKSRGGLYLDFRSGWEVGGERGPAVIPGETSTSLLLRAVTVGLEGDSDLRMPPDGKSLSEREIGLLRQWIEMGAPDPRGINPLEEQRDAAARHWAFQPVQAIAPPSSRSEGWQENPIDRFIAARLEAVDLQPSARATKRALIRRLKYSLLGLPPTFQEVQAFEHDDSPAAYDSLVERYLSSPHYGERWARHWMDVSRYADSKGYVFTAERHFGYAYTYRDYLIRAFNDDLPYDRFILEQLAADQLALGEDNRALAGMGYLTLGRRFLNNNHDIIDDRIDVTTRGLMGLTVSCARCHDHKYDPIPTKDYYSLYGVFASSREPGEKPLLYAPEPPVAYEAFLEEKARRREKLRAFDAKANAKIRKAFIENAGTYLRTAIEGLEQGSDSAIEDLSKSRQLNFGVVKRWMKVVKAWEGSADRELRWIFSTFSNSGSEGLGAAARAARLVDQITRENGETPLGILIEAEAPDSLEAVSQLISRFALSRLEAGFTIGELPASGSHLERHLFGPDQPFAVNDGYLRQLYDVPTIQTSRRLGREVDKLDATHPGAPPRAMSMVDAPTLVEPVVFRRGKPGSRGEKVARQFLGVLAGEARKPFEKGSGRLEMAEAIASRDNPLTARVFVNRVWALHFGQGLVSTPSDFGLRADPPTHPDLLDYLANRFMAEGWSVKKLQRLILTSRTFQQSSRSRESAESVDPENRLLWRMNRKRLDLEAMRDSLLAASGRLSLKQGGQSVPIADQADSVRRSVYGFIDRQNLPSFFRTFDLASPDISSPKRFTTTVPQQALYLLNNPFVIRQATDLVTQLSGSKTRMEAINRLYRRCLHRNPSEEERRLTLAFIEGNSNKQEGWKQLAQSLLISNEFMFID